MKTALKPGCPCLASRWLEYLPHIPWHQAHFCLQHLHGFLPDFLQEVYVYDDCLRKYLSTYFPLFATPVSQPKQWYKNIREKLCPTKYQRYSYFMKMKWKFSVKAKYNLFFYVSMISSAYTTNDIMPHPSQPANWRCFNVETTSYMNIEISLKWHCQNKVRISTSYQPRSGFQPHFDLISTKVRISRLKQHQDFNLTSTRSGFQPHFNLTSTKVEICSKSWHCFNVRISTSYQPKSGFQHWKWTHFPSKLIIKFYNWILDQMDICLFSGFAISLIFKW